MQKFRLFPSPTSRSLVGFSVAGRSVTSLPALLIFSLVLFLPGCKDYLTDDYFIGTGGNDATGGGTDGGGVDNTDSPSDDDADGLSNEVEDSFGGESLEADSDQDGYDDGLEFVGNGGDPLNGSASPTPFSRFRILEQEDAVRNDPDSDLDGLGDMFETENGLDPQDPDIDDDGYHDGLELVANSDPFDASDRPERLAPPAPDGVDRLPPSPRDADGDGLSDEIENINGSTTTQRDTDGDGFSDALEFLMGSDELDFLSIPNFNIPSPPADTSS